MLKARTPAIPIFFVKKCCIAWHGNHFLSNRPKYFSLLGIKTWRILGRPENIDSCDVARLAGPHRPVMSQLNWTPSPTLAERATTIFTAHPAHWKQGCPCYVRNKIARMLASAASMHKAIPCQEKPGAKKGWTFISRRERNAIIHSNRMILLQVSARTPMLWSETCYTSSAARCSNLPYNTSCPYVGYLYNALIKHP